ncbi:hypothetical protein HDE_07040 [Halotydeus destructor]|nr:hypothetical protein HDE_07040 [Halotydeus destructor]
MSFCAQEESIDSIICAMKKVDEKMCRKAKLEIELAAVSEGPLNCERIAKDLDCLKASNEKIKEILAKENGLKLEVYKSQEMKAFSETELIVTTGNDYEAAQTFLKAVKTQSLDVSSTEVLKSSAEMFSASDKLIMQNVSKLASYKRFLVQNETRRK